MALNRGGGLKEVTAEASQIVSLLRSLSSETCQDQTLGLAFYLNRQLLLL